MKYLLLCLLQFFLTFYTAWGIQNVLSSHPQLRCCMMDEPPICFRNKHTYWNNGLDGVVKEHLLQHQSYLNWTCSSMRLFRSATNDTAFNAFVSNMHQCTNPSTGEIIDSPHCQCDIGIGGWFQTSSRFGLVDYLPPFAYDRYVVFTHISEATVAGKAWFFVQTFDSYAWTAIFGLFVMFSFLKTLDKRFAVPDEYEPLPRTYSKFRRYGHYLTKSNLPFRLRKAIQSTVMRMFGMDDEPVVRDGNTTRQWFLNVILAVAALFLVLSYEASMTASLVQESILTKFESAADLLNCHVPPSEICILRGGALETYWNNSIAIDACHAGNPPNYKNSYETLFEAIEKGECKYAVVIESAISSAIRERYCGHFVVVGQPFWDGGLSMLLPRGSKLTEIMSRATLDLLGNETIPSVMQYFNNLPKCNVPVESKLSFRSLWLFFIIAYSLGGVLFLAMVLIPQPAWRGNGSRGTVISNESREAKPDCSCSGRFSTDASEEESIP